MIDVLRREFIYLWYYFDIQFRQIVGYWAIGIVIGSVISVFGKNRIHRLFQRLQTKRLGVLGVIPASAIGIISPLACMARFPSRHRFRRKACRMVGWQPL